MFTLNSLKKIFYVKNNGEIIFSKPSVSCGPPSRSKVRTIKLSSSFQLMRKFIKPFHQ